jgi:crotonobetainyl-CoA:carnitine CoA-transferase CaiB-like acyl-CoA transferase
MTALYAREKHGFGQEVQTSLLESALYQLTFDVAAALTTRQDENLYRLENFEGTPEENTERKRLIADAMGGIRRLIDFGRQRAPNPLANAYETNDGIMLRFNSLLADKYWPVFCEITGHNELVNDDRFNSTDKRKENRKELYFILKDAFLKKTFEEWKPLIADIPYSVPQNLAQVIDDPQVRANDFFLQVEHPVRGKIEVLNSPVKMSETPATYRMSAPEFGQHTEEVLLEAGYSWEDIATFRDNEVVG